MTESKSPQLVDDVSKKVNLPRKAVLALALLDARALGVACGAVGGLWLWLATIILVLRGGEHVGRNLSLLSQYLIGFEVTPAGSLLALAYGLAAGFLAGYVFARLRNGVMRAYLSYVRRRAERMALSDMLDRIM